MREVSSARSFENAWTPILDPKTVLSNLKPQSIFLSVFETWKENSVFRVACEQSNGKGLKLTFVLILIFKKETYGLYLVQI